MKITKKIKAAQKALDAANKAKNEAIFAVGCAENILEVAILEANPRTACDYRIVIAQDDTPCWASDEAMLEDIFGDCWKDDDGNIEESAQTYIDAWSGREGIAAWYGTLYVRNPVTGRFESEDAVSGFYSLGWQSYDADVEAIIREYLEPSGIEGVEIVSERDIEILNS